MSNKPEINVTSFTSFCDTIYQTQFTCSTLHTLREDHTILHNPNKLFFISCYQTKHPSTLLFVLQTLEFPFQLDEKQAQTKHVKQPLTDTCRVNGKCTTNRGMFFCKPEDDVPRIFDEKPSTRPLLPSFSFITHCTTSTLSCTKIETLPFSSFKSSSYLKLLEDRL